MKFKLTIHH